MGFNCGIVGLPNVGKSTLFNALTATAAAEAANYPFCTIEPNVGRVGVPDDRLTQIARMANSAKIIPTQLEFIDIAGIIRGASQGEGLGNQFLSHIRGVDAIIHVLRCFDDQDVTHVDDTVDPLRDLTTIETELLLADLESVEKRILSLAKIARGGDGDAKTTLALLEKVVVLLRDGKPAKDLAVSGDDVQLLQRQQLLSTKPLLYACNVLEHEASQGNKYTELVSAYAAKQGVPMVIISAAIEAEVATLDSEEDRQSYLESMGLKETGLTQVVRQGYGLLKLLTYFTAGPKETRAWTITAGMKAPQAAGVIHSDFERGFICAEVTSYTDFVAYQGEAGAKAAGKLRLEGKEYIVQDGDVCHFRFNV
jgi:GTP-binding protein YchF